LISSSLSFHPKLSI